MERRIITGLITSTEYIQRIQDRWSIQLIESATAKRLATWCMEYYSKYQKAPGRQIEAIFYQKAKNGLSNDLKEEIEEDILPSLSDEYEKEGLNIDYLVDETIQYFTEKHLIKYGEEIAALAKDGQLIEAEKKASSFTPIAKESGEWTEMSEETVLNKIDRAFNRNNECLIHYPGALGDFWNDQLVRGAFVALMGSEKRGKTFQLIEMAMRACKQGQNVAFFEAGDMNESQLLKRICIYLARKSDKKKYAGQMFEPARDCILNQCDQCDKEERSCNFGIFSFKNEKEIKTLDDIRSRGNLNVLKTKFKEYRRDYQPCCNCEEFEWNRWGTPWIKTVDVGEPLLSEEAKKVITEFFIKYGRKFKISCHPSGTLTVKHSLSIMDIWEKQENFTPSVVIYDYPDIMTDDIVKDFRAKQNQIWMDMRGVSDKKHCLTIAVTQADADSYERNLLKLDNFSEDKRKYSHVTAMYGLNQDPQGREKELGILRINELVVREGDFNNSHQVYILQNLRRGRPFISSYL